MKCAATRPPAAPETPGAPHANRPPVAVPGEGLGVVLHPDARREAARSAQRDARHAFKIHFPQLRQRRQRSDPGVRYLLTLVQFDPFE